MSNAPPECCVKLVETLNSVPPDQSKGYSGKDTREITLKELFPIAKTDILGAQSYVASCCLMVTFDIQYSLARSYTVVYCV